MNPAIAHALPPLSPSAHSIVAALYEHQPATREQVAKRTGLDEAALDSGLGQLNRAGILRGYSGSVTGRFLWLDLVPTLRQAAVSA